MQPDVAGGGVRTAVASGAGRAEAALGAPGTTGVDGGCLWDNLSSRPPVRRPGDSRGAGSCVRADRLGGGARTGVLNVRALVKLRSGRRRGRGSRIRHVGVEPGLSSSAGGGVMETGKRRRVEEEGVGTRVTG